MEKVREALEAALEMRKYITEALTSNSYEDAPSIRSCWFEVEAIEHMIKDALAALPSCEGWRGIESAPDTVECVDLWVVPGPWYGAKAAPPRRVANARRSGRDWVTHNGDYIEGRRFRDEQGREFFDPNDRSSEATVATHWMPPPSPPERKET